MCVLISITLYFFKKIPDIAGNKCIEYIFFFSYVFVLSRNRGGYMLAENKGPK